MIERLKSAVSPFSLALLNALGSILLGLAYHPEAARGRLISFAWLGHEAGSEGAAVRLWAEYSILAGGILLCLSLFLLKWEKLGKVSRALLLLPSLVIAAFQLAPLLWWFYVALMSRGTGIVMLLIHFMLLILSLRSASETHSGRRWLKRRLA